jgi:predicted GNAT family acetyltransferase
VEIKYYKNATDFLVNTEKYLARDEARYGLVLGIARVVERQPHRYGAEDPWFCTAGAGNVIYAAAIRTPPYMVILAYFSGDTKAVAGEIAAAVFKNFRVIPGVMGDKEIADVFADLWCRKHGTRIVISQAQRIYRLDKVNDFPAAPGRVRVAAAADKELVKKWAHAFHVDVGGEKRKAPEGDPTPGLEHGAVFLWEDGNRPVSMAVKGRPTDKGMTIGYVYTPPGLRGKGYATSCVAELSRDILRSGKEFCTLYTDLANPTSNSIYRKIGYYEVCDSVEYTFEAPKGR